MSTRLGLITRNTTLPASREIGNCPKKQSFGRVPGTLPDVQRSPVIPDECQLVIAFCAYIIADSKADKFGIGGFSLETISAAL